MIIEDMNAETSTDLVQNDEILDIWYIKHVSSFRFSFLLSVIFI